MTESQKQDWRFSSLIRFAGYALLVLALFDLISIFIPPRFTNPVWEFQMIGAVVEHVPVPLIGLVFVFYGEANYRNKAEIHLLKFLSWASLLVGLLFLLLLPLGINNTWRINNQNNIQITNQYSQQLSQLLQVKEQLSKAKTNEEIYSVLTSLNRQGRSPEIKNPFQLKSRLMEEVAAAEKNVNAQAEAARANTRQELLKNSIKWNLGALVSGAVFIWSWQATRWARRRWM